MEFGLPISPEGAKQKGAAFAPSLNPDVLKNVSFHAVWAASQPEKPRINENENPAKQPDNTVETPQSNAAQAPKEDERLAETKEEGVQADASLNAPGATLSTETEKEILRSGEVSHGRSDVHVSQRAAHNVQVVENRFRDEPRPFRSVESIHTESASARNSLQDRQSNAQPFVQEDTSRKPVVPSAEVIESGTLVKQQTQVAVEGEGRTPNSVWTAAIDTSLIDAHAKASGREDGNLSDKDKEFVAPGERQPFMGQPNELRSGAETNNAGVQRPPEGMGLQPHASRTHDGTLNSHIAQALSPEQPRRGETTELFPQTVIPSAARADGQPERRINIDLKEEFRPVAEEMSANRPEAQPEGVSGKAGETAHVLSSHEVASSLTSPPPVKQEQPGGLKATGEIKGAQHGREFDRSDNAPGYEPELQGEMATEAKDNAPLVHRLRVDPVQENSAVHAQKAVPTVLETWSDGASARLGANRNAALSDFLPVDSATMNNSGDIEANADSLQPAGESRLPSAPYYAAAESPRTSMPTPEMGLKSPTEMNEDLRLRTPNDTSRNEIVSHLVQTGSAKRTGPNFGNPRAEFVGNLSELNRSPLTHYNANPASQRAPVQPLEAAAMPQTEVDDKKPYRAPAQGGRNEFIADLASAAKAATGNSHGVTPLAAFAGVPQDVSKSQLEPHPASTELRPTPVRTPTTGMMPQTEVGNKLPVRAPETTMDVKVREVFEETVPPAPKADRRFPGNFQTGANVLTAKLATPVQQNGTAQELLVQSDTVKEVEKDFALAMVGTNGTTTGMGAQLSGPVDVSTLAANRVEFVRNITQQISMQSDGALQNGVEIQLDPAELGSMRIKLSPLENGALSLTITVERGETFDLLRRHSDLAERMFKELGYTDVAVDLGMEDPRQRENPQRQPVSESETGAVVLPPSRGPSQTPDTGPSRNLDILV